MIRTHLVTRADLDRTARLCYEILDDPNSSASLRRSARRIKNAVGFTLCHENLCSGEIPAAPWGFDWSQYYEIEVVEPFLASLPEAVLTENPVMIQIARHATKLVDTHRFSVTYRLECLDELNSILTTLKRYADEYETEKQEVST